MARVLRTSMCVLLLSVGLGGCALDVDLTASENAPLGGTIDLKVKVTNESNCPVRNVFAVVIPNVPRNLLIDQIPDDDLRRHVSRAVDEFCANGGFEVPDGGEAFCRLEGGDLVCTLDLGDGVDIPLGTEESLVVGSEGVNSQISCSSDGDKVTCRIPQPILAEAQEVLDQQGEQLPLICLPLGPIVLCTSLSLSPGEMQMDDFQIDANVPGLVRHFVVAFPEIEGGVCRGGLGALGSVGCKVNADCTSGMFTGTCKPGICSGSTTSSENGRGCDPMIATDCDNGTCSVCDTPDENVLSGLACDTTAVGAAAPTMSMWGYGVTAIALCAATMFLLMRARRREV